VSLRLTRNINTGPLHRRVILVHCEPLTALRAHPDEPGLCAQRVPSYPTYLLGSQSGVIQVVASVNQAVPALSLSLYLPPRPNLKRGVDEDLVSLELVVQILCPALGMVKHKEVGEEVVNSPWLAHCLVLRR
jgi:hypothetical protein